MAYKYDGKKAMYRKQSKKSSYWMSEEEKGYVMNFAYRYQEFKDKLEELGDGNRAISYDSQPHAEANGSALEDLAIRRSKISSKVDLIESTCQEVDPDLYFWLLKGVTSRSASYEYLRYQLRIPCGRNYYFERKNRFYYLLLQKLDALNMDD